MSTNGNISLADLLQGFKTVMEIDTIGVFNMSTAAFPALRGSGEGSIINISMTLHYGATWFQAHASAAKAAIDSLTRYLMKACFSRLSNNSLDFDSSV